MFNLFSKKVYDEDLCFIRDLISIAERLSTMTSVQVWGGVVNRIIDQHNLGAKFSEYENNGHYDIQDCYPTNNLKKLDRARALLNIPSSIALNAQEKGLVLYSIFQCIKKMQFSRNEKEGLLKECLLQDNSNPALNDYLLNSYLEQL